MSDQSGHTEAKRNVDRIETTVHKPYDVRLEHFEGILPLRFVPAPERAWNEARATKAKRR